MSKKTRLKQKPKKKKCELLLTYKILINKQLYINLKTKILNNKEKTSPTNINIQTKKYE